AKRPRDLDFVLRSFTGQSVLDPGVNWLREPEVDFLLRRSHRKLAGRDESQLHADAVGELDRHAEMLGPGFLELLCLRRVKWSHSQWRRRGILRRCLVVLIR